MPEQRGRCHHWRRPQRAGHRVLSGQGWFKPLVLERGGQSAARRSPRISSRISLLDPGSRRRADSCPMLYATCSWRNTG